jgi:protein-S-isoprenylcysteine O-methyltransferase Ste14
MNLGGIMMTVSALWIGSEIILARWKHSGSTDTRLDASSLRILWTTIALAVTAAIVCSSLDAGQIGDGVRTLRIAGILLIVCGLVIRWISILTLNDQFTVDVSIAKDQRIITTGPYRFVRHPAYAGSLLSFLGLGLSFGNYLSMLVLLLPICSAFLYRIHVEEKALREHVGEAYAAYSSSTKRLIPWVY